MLASNSSSSSSPKPRREHWFWKYVMASRPVYYQVIVASVLINIFALVSPIERAQQIAFREK